MASSGSQRMSRDEYKKQRELDELRKSGAVPAEVDEDGQMINPHIPNYISQAPWYLNHSHPSLKHQKADQLPALSDIHRTGRRHIVQAQGTGFRKGACENCGSLTHAARDCVDRPRRRGARYTGAAIRPDEYVESVALSFDGKRDRWNGYDPASYQRVIDTFERTEQARAEHKAAELELEEPQNDASAADRDSDSNSDDDDEDCLEDGADDLKDSGVVIQKRDARTRTTVRNLRIREDRAKYLINLDTASAYYDPKSRSMRENPHTDMEANQVAYAGDNFVRASGDTKKFAQLTAYAWDGSERGLDVHPSATPSQAEYMFRKEKEKQELALAARRAAIVEKYGGEAHNVSQRDSRMVLGQSEHYVEYRPDGRVAKGAELASKRSKYQEDVHERGHTSVFGSYYADGKWGYQCCHQLMRNAFCTGDVGKLPPMIINPSKAFARPAAAKAAPVSSLAAGTPTDVDLDSYHRTRKRDFDPADSFRDDDAQKRNKSNAR